MEREELINSVEYQLDQLQNELFRQTEKYMSENKLTKQQFAERIGCSVKTVNSVLNGRFDGKLSTYLTICQTIGFDFNKY